jgi:GNAT superfamily N-acetyltransferase
MAWRDGRPVGRVAAIENRAHNAFHDDRVGFFGWFEAADDAEAAAALLDAAGDWLRRRGLAAMRGPVSPSTNHETGLLVDGFDAHPFVMTPWNPPYYGALLERCGLHTAKDLLGWHLDARAPDYALPPRYAELADRARADAGIRLRQVDLGAFDREVSALWGVYNAAWERNWGFVPMTRPEFEHLARDLKLIVDPRLALVAEVDGEAAGFLLVLPDINRLLARIRSGRLFPTGLLTLLAGRRRLTSARVLALGVRREHRTRGLLPLFFDELLRRGRRLGVLEGEASWILEDNHLMNRPLRAIGARPYRRWRLYERPLAAAPTAAPAGSGDAA